MATHKDFIVDKSFLDLNPKIYFVFGDNEIRKGYGGAAMLRDHPRTYGFITKKYPDNRDSSFYDCEEYRNVFKKELERFKIFMSENNEYDFYISQLGGGLANRYGIWENIIKKELENEFEMCDNVVLLWNK